MINLANERGYILIIHSDIVVRDTLVNKLLEFGHTVVAVCELEEGLALFQQDNHQLVMVELALAKPVLALVSTNYPETPVITVSSDVSMDMVVESLKNGAVDHFFDFRDVIVLAHTVQRALERGRLLRQNRDYQQQLEAANAELERSLETLQADQEAGRRIQFRLLPQTPYHVDSRCQVTHRILPSLYLSGDFIDYFKIGEGKLGFYLADVSGHGAASAFVTVFLKAITNRIQKHYERKTTVNYVAPAKILAMINDELIATRMGKHLAMFCGVIDFEHNKLTYSVAAHYPPPLLVNNGITTALAGRGLPLGLFKEVSHDEYVVELTEEFVLIATSDGVLEVLPKGTANEKEKQLSAMASHIQTVDDMITALNLSDEVELPDDVALLVINRSKQTVDETL
ncbi:PP2C family protein-serine/threonine phosphatase [Agitococcus lubricus]|uniref:Serine phosphatase RsbU (Regulator of sigma subunit) n=1 Tax=Agitococcus lubricus TaxID=1077255 RepID=A0A2T5IX33_9GAMM|nr:fused response regulator/phosphatase [Agitococcus lubricus]PTQ88511.1 serine phosphatase RsbU (regulator of sigma subunit) [Agitococcus lubricus]